MKIKAFKSITDPQPVVAEGKNVIVVEDDKGQPLFVACQQSMGARTTAHIMAHADEPDFNTILQNLGFKKLTIVEEIAKPPTV